MGEENPASREHIISVCQQMLDGKIGVIHASRQLRDLAFKAFTDHNMLRQFDPFIGIDSEADGIPLGAEKSHWSEEALKRKESELTVLEQRYHDLAFKSAHELLEYLKKDV